MTILGQTWDPDRYSRNARFVSDLGMPVVELLAPAAGERILDLGCGDGVLSAHLVELGCTVVGIDGSPEQVEAARRRGVDARSGDAQQLSFDGEFDAVFSNAALHWMLQPDRVIEGVWRALKPGGRFVGEMGGDGCIRTIAAAIHAELARRGIDADRVNPWYFPTAEEYGKRLVSRGFTVASIVLFPRPTPLPSDVTGWLDTFARSFTAALPPEAQATFIEDVRERLRPDLCDARGNWTADYTRLRFDARKPATADARPLRSILAEHNRQV
jgi:trans-aconitate methyltransferase